MCEAYPDQAAALLSVELCSLDSAARRSFHGAPDFRAALWRWSGGDLVVGSESKSDGPEILATKSSFYPHTRKVMGWDISEKGFRIVLSPEVPDTVTKHLGKDVDEFLAENGAKRSDIKSWIMHTGGPKVLEATANALGITADDLSASWTCLRQRGKYFFHVRIAGFGRRVHQPSSGTGFAEHSGRDGPWLLRGVSFVTLVGSGGQWPQARKS